MPRQECAAYKCEKSAYRNSPFCWDHKHTVPARLRQRLEEMVERAEHLTTAYAITRSLAIRAVGVCEGVWLPDPEKRKREIFRWTAARDRLRLLLAENYGAEIRPYIDRLQKLLEQTAGDDPLEVAALAIRYGGPRSNEENARRVAAAVELHEQTNPLGI